MSPPFSISPDGTSDKNKTTAATDEEQSNNESNPNSDDDGSKPQVAVVPLISLRQGLEKKVPPTSLTPWIKLSLTLDGRDKITKVIQYSARLLAYLFREDATLKAKFGALKDSLTTSRKAYRLGRSVTELDKLLKMESLWSLLMFLKANQGTAGTQPRQPWWKTVGMTIKTLGLLGFWLGDNVNFLAMSGLFDDFRQEQQARLKQRRSLRFRVSHFANRSYFVGAVAGLLVNLRSYLLHLHTEMKLAATRAASCDDEKDDPTALTKKEQVVLEARQTQFSLVVALLKSCCDVVVFSNNPGIDLHLKYRGRKNNEILHCVCGLLSASAVLYNNYPNKP